MKKVILGVLSVLTVLTFAGCGTEPKEEVKLDLNKISTELSSLTTDEMDIQSIDVETMEEYSEGIEYIYDFDFQEKLGLDSSLVTESKVYYNAEAKEIFAVLKPALGKKEEIKNQLNSLMTGLNAKFEEVNGLLVYVASKNNDVVINKVKESKVTVFVMIKDVPNEQIKDILSLEPTDYEEILMGMPMAVVKSNTYIIVKPAEGKEETVKNALDSYMTALENQWATYLPDQYELVQNRKVEKIGEYLVYIVSSNNDLAYNTILNNKIAE